MPLLLPVLWRGTVDAASEVSIAADVALQASFPPGKLSEAIATFAQSLVDDALTTLALSPEDVSDPKTFTAEECADRWLRLQLCAVLAVRKLIVTLTASPPSGSGAIGLDTLTCFAERDAAAASDDSTSPQAILSVLAAMLTLCSIAANVQSHSLIRRACIDSIAQFVVLLPSAIVTPQLPTIAGTLPHMLEERLSENMAAVWTALLQILRLYPAVLQHLNVNKTILPKLLHLIRKKFHDSGVRRVASLMHTIC